jgi:hypothetical protein
MKLVVLFAWGLLLPFIVCFALIAMTHVIPPHFHTALVDLFPFGVALIVGGGACFRLPLSLPGRIAGFVIYIPVVGAALAVSDIFFECGVFHNCP